MKYVLSNLFSGGFSRRFSQCKISRLWTWGYCVPPDFTRTASFPFSVHSHINTERWQIWKLTRSLEPSWLRILRLSQLSWPRRLLLSVRLMNCRQVIILVEKNGAWCFLLCQLEWVNHMCLDTAALGFIYNSSFTPMLMFFFVLLLSIIVDMMVSERDWYLEWLYSSTFLNLAGCVHYFGIKIF
mgnify:CR=1 FL=1